MQPGGYNPRPNAAPPGRHGNGGSGFRPGSNRANAPSNHNPPAPSQMTQQQRQQVLLDAGRLAAEYLVSIGELAPHLLQNRPPAPHAPAPPHHQHGPPPPPRPFFAKQQQFRPAQRQFQHPLGPRGSFQYHPIAKRHPRVFQRRPPAPRLFQWRRPFRPGAGRGRGALPAGNTGQGDAAAGVETRVDGCHAQAGPSSDGQPVPQAGGAGDGPQETDQPERDFVGDNAE